MRRRVTGLDVVGEKTLRLDREQYLPPELERQWKEILTDLHDALLAHGENGLSLGGAAFGPELEVAEDVLSRPEGMQAWMFRRDEGRADTLIEPVDYGPYDIFGAYPYKRRPELTPERVARRFLALADSLKSPDDFSEARVLETTRLPMERSGTGNGRFVIYLPDSDWYCFFFYVDDNRFEPGATYKFVHGTRARGETEVFADMAPVCRMCFDAYVSSLLRMGFETDEFQDRDQIGRILSYYYGRNGVGVEIVPNLDGFWPEDKRNCTCVRSIVIRVGASRKKDVRA
jgi:hypothetical protein